jgi:hypothetical protein
MINAGKLTLSKSEGVKTFLDWRRGIKLMRLLNSLISPLMVKEKREAADPEP